MAFSSLYTLQETEIAEQVAAAVRAGLTARPKRLPAWLFYDEAGSRLFEEITELEEYYLTRTERRIFLDFQEEILDAASCGRRLRIAELGAGSAEKTRLLLAGALERQGRVVYEPVDVSATALEAARECIERELRGVEVRPRVADYTRGLELDEAEDDERRLVLYIGSSIGNFEPEQAAALLKGVRAGLRAGDGLLLGVDLVKEDSVLLAAYDDAAGVTAAFNRNVLERVNRELGADFDPEAFAHVAVWNAERRRMEMHLESTRRQTVRVEALGLRAEFGAGERMHTENSYKYEPDEAEAMLRAAGFAPAGRWTDARGWFAVSLGRA
ncbi:MAG TPA: L-histidine N(alpha)-methyltransferase [Terracidiphilus sp.]|nr:L-histidine N(alpha)-methyltransferase [Terracidiphilus sp.]